MRCASWARRGWPPCWAECLVWSRSGCRRRSWPRWVSRQCRYRGRRSSDGSSPTSVAGCAGVEADGHGTFEVIHSMPGLGVLSAAKLLVVVGDGSRFPTAAHLAPYAGLAPVTRQSGTSIGSQRAPRRGNPHVRQIFFFAAVASLAHDPQSRRYYDRKRAQGKRATAALLCLARRKANLLHAMLRNGTLYRAPSAGEVAQPSAA